MRSMRAARGKRTGGSSNSDPVFRFLRHRRLRIALSILQQQGRARPSFIRACSWLAAARRGGHLAARRRLLGHHDLGHLKRGARDLHEENPASQPPSPTPRTCRASRTELRHRPSSGRTCIIFRARCRGSRRCCGSLQCRRGDRAPSQRRRQPVWNDLGEVARCRQLRLPMGPACSSSRPPTATSFGTMS